jgi:hypothetical protein
MLVMFFFLNILLLYGSEGFNSLFVLGFWFVNFGTFFVALFLFFFSYLFSELDLYLNS